MKFYTNAKAKEEIEKRDKQIELLTKENEDLTKANELATEEHKTLSEDLATVTQERGELTKSNEELTDSNAKLTKENAEAQEKLDSFDAEVEKGAQAKFESLGGQPPVPASTKGDDDETKEVTREKFNSWTPRQRSDFSIAGGKVKED